MNKKASLEIFRSLNLIEKTESGVLLPNIVHSTERDCFFIFSPQSITKESLEKSLELLGELEKRKFIELIRIKTHKGRFLFKIIEFSLPKNVSYSERPNNQLDAIWIGRDYRNQDVFLETQETPSLSISGSSGSGKTILLSIILKEAERLNYELSIYDLKNLDWHFIDCPKYFSYESVADNIEKVVLEMRSRFDFLRVNKYENANIAIQNNNWPYKKMFIAFDECGDFFIPSKKADDDNYEYKQRIKVACEELSRLSRSADIFICYSQQETKAESLPKNVVTNLGIRFCFELATPQLSQAIFGSAIACDKSLRKGKGVVQLLDGTVKTFQGAK